MSLRLNSVMLPLAVAIIATAAVAAVLSGSLKNRRPRRPAPIVRLEHRTANPNLNGIWQALNTANWDRWIIRAIRTRRCDGLARRNSGGLGVVEGNEIPYKPEAAAKKKENFDTGSSVTRWSNATCRVCRERPTCPSRSNRPITERYPRCV